MMLLPVTLESKISYFLWNQKYVVSWLTTRIRQLHNVYDILWRARKSICLSPKVRVFLCSWIYERTTEWSWVCPWLVHHGECYSGECVFWECNIGECDTGGCILGDCNIGECLCKCDIDRCVLRECQHGECGIGERPSCIPCYLYPNTRPYKATMFSPGHYLAHYTSALLCLSWSEVTFRHCLKLSFISWYRISGINYILGGEKASCLTPALVAVGFNDLRCLFWLFVLRLRIVHGLVNEQCYNPVILEQKWTISKSGILVLPMLQFYLNFWNL